jgi:phosphoserine phosphatase RsbU/P
MHQLRILDFPGRGTFDMEISTGGFVGREKGAEILLEHPTVSRQHAQVIIGASGAVLVDKGSANGTRVNGHKISAPTTLREGDTIEFGKIAAIYFSRNAPTAMAPVAVKPGGTATVEPSTQDVAKVPLASLEHLLSGLLRILSVPGSLAEHARQVSEIFLSLMPDLTQAALLDPCGKLLGAAPGGSLLAAEFYGAMAGMSASQPVLEVDNRQLDALGKQLSVRIPKGCHVVCLQLTAKSFPGGALFLEANKHFFAAEVADLLRLSARSIGPLLDRAPESARLLITHDDLKLAERSQKRLLSGTKSDIENLRLATLYVPHFVVGGDFYDVIELPKKEIAILIGDVSGKGVSASLVMAQIIPLARELAASCNGPAALLTRLNARLSAQLEPGVFATIACAYISADKGACRLALAGHNAPIIRTKTGKVLELGFDPGAPLGANTKLDVKEQRVMLASGDAMIFSTDGLEEAERLDEGAKHRKLELFGNERRNEVVARTSGAQNLAIALREAVFSFSGEERSSDDLTIVVVERV